MSDLKVTFSLDEATAAALALEARLAAYPTFEQGYAGPALEKMYGAQPNGPGLKRAVKETLELWTNVA